MCCTRVQELLKPEDHEEGRVPRTVECELTQDLVDACIPAVAYHDPKSVWTNYKK